MLHFILDHSKRYDEPATESLTPPNGRYNSSNGYWEDIHNGKALIGSSAFDHVNSKKWDRETGEDQKGE